MTDKELIKQEIERLKEENSIGLCEYDAGYCNGVGETCSEILQFIDSFPKEPTSEDLDEEVHKHLLNIGATIEMYSGNVMGLDLCEDDYVDFARHFAEWQKKQMMKDAVTAYISLCHDYPHRRSLVAIEDSLSNFEYAEKIKLIPIKEEQQ